MKNIIVFLILALLIVGCERTSKLSIKEVPHHIDNNLLIGEFELQHSPIGTYHVKLYADRYVEGEYFETFVMYEEEKELSGSFYILVQNNDNHLAFNVGDDREMGDY